MWALKVSTFYVSLLLTLLVFPGETKHLGRDEQAGEKYEQTKHLGMGRTDRWKKEKKGEKTNGLVKKNLT